MEQMIFDLLNENDRRNAELNRTFNPVSGLGSTGRRFAEAEGLQTVWLPESMRDCADVRDLMNVGGVEALLYKRFNRHPTASDRERWSTSFRRLRMEHDFAYWAATVAYIKNKRGGDDMLFVLNRPQRRLVERLEEMRLAGRPIRLILLKARQWGGAPAPRCIWRGFSSCTVKDSIRL